METPTPLTMLNAALERPGTDTAIILRLTDLYQQWLRDTKEQAYTAAMLLVQGELHPIFRDSENQSTRSRYASLDAVVGVVGPILQRHGFVPSFGSAPSDKPDHVLMQVHLMHAGGHREMRQASYPMDAVGLKGQPNKTPIQGTVSAHSYAQRNLLKLALNLNFTGEDNDGQRAAPPDPPISEAQAMEVMDMVDRLPPESQAAFLGWIGKLGAKRVGEIPTSRYAMAAGMLKRKLDAIQKLEGKS